MIPITEDELTELLKEKIAIATVGREPLTMSCVERCAAEARRLARLMLASEQMYEALKVADVHIGWTDCSLENVHKMCRSALAAAEGRKA